MLIGYPASGKTTYAKLIVEQGAVLFSPDKWLEDTSEGKYNWTPARASEAWTTETNRFEKWLVKRDWVDERTALWDATFVTIRARSKILKMAKEAGYKVEACVLDTPPDVCIKRNSERPEDRRVPQNVMDRMIDSRVPPSDIEGFDDIRYISSYFLESK